MCPSGVHIGRITLAVCVVSCLAACSHPASSGTLHGQLRGVGGIAPGINSPFPGSIPVTGSDVDTQVAVGPGGSWSLVVPAGTYTVEGRSPNLVWNGAEVPCRPASSQQPAVVSADQTTTVDVYCALR